MTWCRTVDEVRAAALEDSKNDPPLNQAQADYLAAVLAANPLPPAIPPPAALVA